MSDPGALERLAEREDFLWHQRFALAPGIHAPGANDVDWLLSTAGVPAELNGASVLDIGTTNGGAAFTLERRGAGRVVATDIVGSMHFGFDAIREALGSRVEFLRVSVYELPQVLHEEFDYVIFWGVLYHLRHPLLALDSVRAMTRMTAYVETAVCDAEIQSADDIALSRFYRRDELGGDTSNWFAPNVHGLLEWCRSCGLEPDSVSSWPSGAPSRAMVCASAVPGPAEFRLLSYEVPLVVSAPEIGADAAA